MGDADGDEQTYETSSVGSPEAYYCVLSNLS